MAHLDTIIFCNRQYVFMMIMSKLHIARLLKHEECYDPITGKVVCKHVLIRLPKFLKKTYAGILNGLNNGTGRSQLNRLMGIGAISKK